VGSRSRNGESIKSNQIKFIIKPKYKITQTKTIQLVKEGPKDTDTSPPPPKKKTNRKKEDNNMQYAI